MKIVDWDNNNDNKLGITKQGRQTSRHTGLPDGINHASLTGLPGDFKNYL